MQAKEDINSLKSDIFEVFKRQGFDQNLKAQMRANLLSCLKGSNQVKVSQLSKRVICGLFLDFMKKENFRYTPTVFVPECGQNESVLSPNEIQELLHLPEIPEISIVEFIVEKIKDFYEKKHVTESYTQTEDSPRNGLENRLQILDSEFLSKTRGFNEGNIEERMAKYRKECDERVRIEINSELVRIREVEISAVRIEEASKYRQQLQKVRSEQEEFWQNQLESLKDREKELRERIQIREKDLEVREYRQRQDFEKSLEILKSKENDLKRSAELELEAAQLQKRSWEQKKIEVENKLKDIENFKVSMINKAQEDFNHYKRKFEADFDDEKRRVYNEKHELQVIKETLNQELDRIKESESRFKAQGQELLEVRKKFDFLKEEYEKILKEMGRSKEELRLVTETSRRDLDLLTFKDQELNAVKNECKAYREMYQEQKDTIKKLEASMQALMEKFMNDVVGGRGPAVDNEFLVERKAVWRQLEKESLDIKKSMVDMIQGNSNFEMLRSSYRPMFRTTGHNELRYKSEGIREENEEGYENSEEKLRDSKGKSEGKSPMRKYKGKELASKALEKEKSSMPRKPEEIIKKQEKPLQVLEKSSVSIEKFSSHGHADSPTGKKVAITFSDPSEEENKSYEIEEKILTSSSHSESSHSLYKQPPPKNIKNEVYKQEFQFSEESNREVAQESNESSANFF
ncbi:hypothetical protein SteCoe_35408 [Stentor coeruleus]|uniref:LisH domain-containing protein n=1 Tax=Stentor coeruleus TaxID=5963 RepID=A0A1R2ASK3_9CILI|nr:hypothetical protein SteCoe_35408 [Stentor coeruleus]